MRARLALTALVTAVLAGCSAPERAASRSAETPAAAPPIAPTAAMGAQVFKRCTACHTIDKGGRHGVGPNLHGVVGRAVAAAAGFDYSNAMLAKGGVWDAAALDAYLTAPAQTVPGGRMAFAGLAEASERDALILYLAEQR